MSQLLQQKSEKKILIMTTSGRNFQVDAHEVIHHRAEYFTKSDPDLSYQEEYRSVMDNEEELLDWLFSNMRWQKCKTLIELAPDIEKLKHLEVEDYSVKG